MKKDRVTVITKISNRISDYNRERKYEIFCRLFRPTADTKILDVGASEKEYQKKANILEKKYPYPENITVLGIDNYKNFFIRYPEVQVRKYDGDNFPFKDKEFDICWSNAVLEHVGDRDRQEKFLREIYRVARKGFITTPNRYFPVEVHTKIPLLHYLPKENFDRILNKLGKSWAAGNRLNLLGIKDIKRLLERCAISNYKIIQNRLLCFTVDFVIMF